MNQLALQRFLDQEAVFQSEASGFLYARAALDGRRWLSTEPPGKIISLFCLTHAGTGGRDWTLRGRTGMGSVEVTMHKIKRPFRKAILNTGVSHEGVVTLNGKEMGEVELADGESAPLVDVRNRPSTHALRVVFRPCGNRTMAVGLSPMGEWISSELRGDGAARVKAEKGRTWQEKARNFAVGENLFDAVAEFPRSLRFDEFSPIALAHYHAVLMLWEGWVLEQLAFRNDRG